MNWELLKIGIYENFVKYVGIKTDSEIMDHMIVGITDGKHVREISFFYKEEGDRMGYFRKYFYEENKPVAVKTGSDAMFSKSTWSDSMKREIDKKVMAHFNELTKLRPDLKPVIRPALRKIRKRKTLFNRRPKYKV